MARVVVIGAGIGGMAVAARLRVKGHEVTVVEAAETYGGQVGTFHRDGFRFDTGPTTFTLPAVYRDLFLKTGAPLEECVELVPLDPATQYRFADGTTLHLPGVGAGRCATAVGEALGGRSADEWRALLQRAGRMWTAIRRPVLESPVSGPRDLLPLATDLETLRTLAPWRTVRGLGRATLTDPRARQVLERWAWQVGSDPRRAPATLATLPYVEATFGTWQIAGGLRTLADALHDRLLERRVEVRLSTPADRIEVAGGRVTGVRLADGRVLPADVVVAAVPVSLVHRRLLDERSPGADRRIASQDAGSSLFTMLLAVRGRTEGLDASHTVWLPQDGDAALAEVFGRTPRPAEDPAIQVSISDDDATRPPGHEAWVVRVDAPRHRHPTARGTVDWDPPGLAEGYADRILARLAERGPDLAGRILWRELRTPADLERATGAPGGAVHAPASHGVRGGLLRPSNRTGITGLFLVGSSAHPGPGLPRVGLSAEIVAGLIGRA